MEKDNYNKSKNDDKTLKGKVAKPFTVETEEMNKPTRGLPRT